MWKAEAENICGYDGTVLVAVKTTKEKAPDKEKSDLLQEMQIMQKMGHHPNVVTLLGVSIDKGITYSSIQKSKTIKIFLNCLKILIFNFHLTYYGSKLVD